MSPSSGLISMRTTKRIAPSCPGSRSRAFPTSPSSPLTGRSWETQSGLPLRRTLRRPSRRFSPTQAKAEVAGQNPQHLRGALRSRVPVGNREGWRIHDSRYFRPGHPRSERSQKRRRNDPSRSRLLVCLAGILPGDSAVGGVNPKRYTEGFVVMSGGIRQTEEARPLPSPMPCLTR